MFSNRSGATFCQACPYSFFSLRASSGCISCANASANDSTLCPLDDDKTKAALIANARVTAGVISAAVGAVVAGAVVGGVAEGVTEGAHCHRGGGGGLIQLIEQVLTHCV